MIEKNKEIYWWDLDGTLWNTDSLWWIVDKNNPHSYLLKISQYDGNAIISGYYKNYNKQIYYNGMDGWLSDEIYTKIQRIKKIKLEDIGISFREFQDIDIIKEQAKNLIVYVNRIKHLENNTINLLTARGNKDAHQHLLEELNLKLTDLNIKINDARFINDSKTIMTGTTPERKMKCILENIVGYKIDNNEFIHILCEKYDTSYFYDDEDKNIECCKQINKYLLDYLNNTEPGLKQQIIENIHTRHPKLILNIVNTNELNPFDTYEINIKI